MPQITNKVYAGIVEHARGDSPIEACGYLAEKDGVIAAFYPLENIDKSEQHFSFNPKEQFDTIRAIRSSGLKLAAVYHSHPASPARPSQEDIRLAFDPGLSYLIVSLEKDQPAVKSFKIRKGVVEEESLELTKIE